MQKTNIRAVRNPDESRSEIMDIVKTVAITSAVSSLVGVFAVAGGQALYNTIRRALHKKSQAQQQQAQQQQAQQQQAQQQQAQPIPPFSFYPQEPPGFDPMPESLRMRPYLRQPVHGIRRPREGQQQIQQMFLEFERRAEERDRRQTELLQRLERRLGDMEDNVDYDEESAA